MNDLHQDALAICQQGLARLAMSGGHLRPEDIKSKVEEVLGMRSYATCDPEILISALEQRFTVFTDTHLSLGGDDEHFAWLPARQGEITWRYWDRYRLYQHKRMPPSAVDSIHKVTEEVLARLEDPDRPGPWDRRGLVVGHVQSGKTANYCGLICKALDAGYKVIIVLAGIHNNLRSQTQIRIEEGVLGFMSMASSGRDGGQTFKPIGVGELDKLEAANRANTGTSRHDDFKLAVANNFGVHAGGSPLVFVVKKNVSVLKEVIRWIRSQQDVVMDHNGRRYLKNIPAIVIDDEADQASVDTKLQATNEDGTLDKEHNPTRTNELIRRILWSFDKVAYVGYTATPFANIFIHDKGRTEKLGDDLFPRSFIINLPAPSNYMGPKRIFGIPEDDDAGLEGMCSLPITRRVDDHAASDARDESNGWMPPRMLARTGHVPMYRGERRVPPSLQQAIMSFMISCTVRHLREEAPVVNSMLVHVARFARVQKEVADQVKLFVEEVRMRFKNGDGSRKPTIMEEFKALWDDPQEGYVTTTLKCNTALGSGQLQLPEWQEVAGLLPTIAAGIRVHVVNGTYGDISDYEEHRGVPLDMIMVGGDKLSRGLTLEGLTVSYFLRASRMYDTLMQMGRWFGYREKYIDLCRLYTTPELLEWFAHIAVASEELQREFVRMVEIGATPRAYGLRVRSHPDMLVTSAVKMRHATEMKLSYSGDVSETIVFSKDGNWLRRNHDALEHWLEELGPGKGGVDEGYEWRTDAEQVLDFLAAYSTHEDARRVQTGLLRNYIRKQNEQGELVEWTVRLVSNTADDHPHVVAGARVGRIKRAPFADTEKDEHKLMIRRLVSPSDEWLDLTDAEYEQALEETRKGWRLDPRTNKRKTEPEVPSGIQVREARNKGRGLLLIYLLDNAYVQMPQAPVPVVAIALSFPKSLTATEISYRVNALYDTDDDSI
jgi:hypothetical protein